MYCTTDYSRRLKKWAIIFYDYDYDRQVCRRNERKAEYYDREIDANNRVSEMMIDEDMKYFRHSLGQRLKAQIYSMFDKYEEMKTYTDCEEYRREGAIAVLEDLLARIDE